MKRLVMVFLLSVLVVGCQDQRTVTAPPDATASPGDLLAAISDGARAGGNPDFFFLPPLQPSPLRSRNFDRGRFNPNLRPVVKICDGRNLSNGECAVPLRRKNGEPAVFDAVRGWDGLPDWVDPEQYHVLWRTRDYDLVANGTHAYRVLVKVGSTLLGFLDIVPARTPLGALKITAGGQDVGWLDDWIVPIRFRIERGALCSNDADCTEFTTVGAKAGTAGDTTVAFVLPSRHAALSIPPGAVGEGVAVTIVIEKQDPPHDGECLPTEFGLVQSKGCYQFRSEPEHYQFLKDVRLEACVNVEGLSTADTAALLLHKYNTVEGLVPLPRVQPTLLNCLTFGALGAAGSHAPASFADAVWRGAGRWFANLVGPRELFAATMAGTPKGLGGLAGSFSDVGGAVPGEGGSPDLAIEGALSWPENPTNGSVFTMTVRNIGHASTGSTPFLVGLALYRPNEPKADSLGGVTSLVVDPLGPGDTRTFQFTIPCSWYGNLNYYFVKAVADLTGVVDDADRENNTLESLTVLLGSEGSGYCGS